MAYSNKIKEIYQGQLGEIEKAGLFKKERFIHSSQAADIEVEFPSVTARATCELSGAAFRSTLAFAGMRLLSKIDFKGFPLLICLIPSGNVYR